MAELAAGIRSGRAAALADEPDAVHQAPHDGTTPAEPARRLPALPRLRRGGRVSERPWRRTAGCWGSAGTWRSGRPTPVPRWRTSASPTSLGPVVVAPLEQVHAAAHAVLVEWHAGPEAAALDALLDRWAQEPPLTKRARRPAARVARKAVRRQVRRVLARSDRGAEHDLRKAARRLRHTADAVAAVHARAAALGKLGHQVQGVLGDHRDALLLAEHARRCGAEPLAAYAEQVAAVAIAGLDAHLAALRERADS
ncbi:CHAD domain-containing protein [Nocardioides sp. W3-2-3]|uniref:CHAD domain-containing protein n=1 Tax=Nocardioides convexus TaxID=2712224 RepID=UPI0024184C33|nr:CHAD domain-containing protein [Nocardioides convexus]NHA01813.1 CHAD domain-containing protein [Nocardioides convexus]